MNLVHLRDRIINKPLLLTPAYAEVVVSVLSDRMGVEPMVSDETAQRYVRPAASAILDTRTGIAVLPIVGSMVHRGGYLETASGVQSYTDLHGKLTALIDNPKVRGILLDMDTPGGEAAGITELADWIKKAKSEKPIWSIANTSMTSGGYWLASATDKIIGAPMSSIGSIGVVVMHSDVSKVMEKKGIVNTFIYAGKHKVDGNPYEPLPDDVRRSVQNHVDVLYEQFAATVADNRGLDMGSVKQTEAGVFSPDQAMKLGLIDGVGSLGDTLEAFAEELNRATTWSASRGKYMEKEFTKDDLAAAVKASAVEAKSSVNADFAQAVLATFPGPKGEAFAAALTEGGTLALAVKMAGLVNEPKAEVVEPGTLAPSATVPKGSSFDRVMERAAPGVSAEDSPANLSEADKMAARRAELGAAAKAVSHTRGLGRA